MSAMAARLRTAGGNGALAVLSRLPTAHGARARFVLARRRLDDGRREGDRPGLVRELLAHADAAHARGDGAGAVDWSDKALQLLFHPTVHYGDMPPPTTDPDLAFLAPLRESVVGRLLTAAPDTALRDAPRPGGRRVLILAGSSWTFVDRVAAALAERERFEVRSVDVSTLPEAVRPTRHGVLEARYELATTGRRRPVPAELRADIAWADTIFVEWGSYPFAWFTLLADTGKRVIARLHRFEAYTPYPQLASYVNLDQFLLVSPMIRELLAAEAPRLQQAPEPTLVHNAHDFSVFSADKEAGYDRTLLQVGWAIPVKDVLFTMRVLERLRAEDPSWRLLLAGRGPGESDGPWGRRVRAALDAAGDAVQELGHRSDMPAVFRRAGFLMSSSRNEGVHEAVSEGAAAACLPVVRDWPELRAWGGVGLLFPDSWIVETSEDAAARIRAHADRADLDPARHAAREWLLAGREQETTIDDYEAAVLGPGAS